MIICQIFRDLEEAARLVTSAAIPLFRSGTEAESLSGQRTGEVFRERCAD